jgi:hypothetical protein
VCVIVPEPAGALERYDTGDVAAIIGGGYVGTAEGIEGRVVADDVVARRQCPVAAAVIIISIVDPRGSNGRGAVRKDFHTGRQMKQMTTGVIGGVDVCGLGASHNRR